jgi:hypothetical protein
VQVCVATPNRLRCVGCFLFPFLALAWYAISVDAAGDDLQSYLWSATHGVRNGASALLFVGGSAAWIYVTWPKALAAMRAGRCTISLGQQSLTVYGKTIAISDIASVDLVRRPFDFELQLRLKAGSAIRHSVTLLTPSPDRILTALRRATS